jgi:hypothetical protein
MQAVGRSRGDLTTKILVLVDALGNFACFGLPSGQRYDSVGVARLRRAPRRFAARVLHEWHERRKAARLISSNMLPQKRKKRTGATTLQLANRSQPGK